MTRARARAAFLLILAVGAYWRLSHNLWDEGHHLHPDERFISMVDDKLAAPRRVLDYFDSAHSPLNPYNRGDTSFVYGTLPMFVSRAIGRIFHRTGYDGTYRVGRALSGVFDLVTVWLVYLIARRFARRETALVAAGLFAFNPLSIQLSHFWAVDTFLTAFTTAALFGCVRHALGRSGWAGDAATGVAIGLAVACKITALALLGPAGLAVLARELGAGLPKDRKEILRAVGRASARLAAIAAAALVAARVGLPYAFLGPSPFSFRLDPRWVSDIKRLSSMAKSFAGFPPAFQWADRGVLFPIKNFVLWGATPFFGLAALACLPWAAVAVIRRKTWSFVPILAHEVFLLAYHGLDLVKAMRYWYPAYPGLAITAALGLRALARRFETDSGPIARLARSAPAIVFVGTFLGGFAFSRIYTRPVTRVAASDWIFQHVPPSRFAGESWDDGLPMGRPGNDGGQYRGPVLPLFDPDSPQKAETLLTALGDADWIAVTSNRVWGNVTRLPDVFPMSIAYYRALFQGRLGFERAADFVSYPRLGPWQFSDDTAEEQFTVYDHPRVLLFRKTKDFSRERARQILFAALAKTPPSIAEWERWPRAQRRVTPPVLPGRNPTVERLPDTTEVETPVSAWGAAFLFYVASLAVGLFTLPLAWSLFPRLPDRGAGIARILGLTGVTYAFALALELHLLPNGRLTALCGLLALAAVGAALFARRRDAILAFCRERREFLVKTEIAFALGFVFFLGMRALNPEIYWGEKPMDFSILNILVRTRSLPPSDPWFAGAPLRYYFFGHEMIAFLSLVTGISTRYTFNLAFGWIGGTTFAAAYSLLRNWTGTRRAGIAGVAFTAVLGNLSGLREWLVNQPAAKQPRHLDWHYFWATSRVVPNTINEYPFWSLLFADLHAHVLAIPLFLFFASCALEFVRAHADASTRSREWIAAAALLGFAAAVQALTNAWDVPMLAGLLVLTTIVAAFPPRRVSARAILRAFLSGLVVAACVLALVLPLWVRGGVTPGHGKNGEPPAAGVDILTVFGLFFFLAFAWWWSSAKRRMVDAGWGTIPATFCLAILAAV
ncbi:MAG TPA: DUF2298 domain-containing protein, partial [Thermoanaerobaculia bacterium]|nr:DUF2298 domain-containing protein [Thermoanaerobaculia bacterium]